MKLILASASPRRQSLLREAGYRFDVHTPDVDEDAYLGRMMPIPLAGFLARAKAADVARRFPDDVTLAADTVVAFGDMSVGKPHDEVAAREMIRLLSSTTHVVITGLTVLCPARDLEVSHTVMSAVRMRNLGRDETDAYVASGLWKGKAGGYGIQDPNPIVTCTVGSITNVIGLPVDETKELLDLAGVRPES